MEDFGRILQWFGPFERAMFERIEQVLRLECVSCRPKSQLQFHGFAAADRSELQLLKSPVGSYMVRFSSVMGMLIGSKRQGSLLWMLRPTR